MTGNRGVHVGVDIGGTKISTILVDDAGAVVGRARIPAPARAGGAAMVDAAADAVGRLLREGGWRAISAGAGAAGVIDPITGSVLAASDLFVDWVGFALADELSARLAVPVRALNDVDAFLLGETAGSTTAQDVLGVMLGTGVGGAIMLDGVLRQGPRGMGGEIGHTPGYSDRRCTCGQIGHLETVASGTSIALRYGELGGKAGLDAGKIARLARGGDPVACGVFHDAGSALAQACTSAATLLDLSAVVVGGGVTAAWDLLLPGITASQRVHRPVSGSTLCFVRAVHGGDAVALGAVAAARDLSCLPA